MYCAIPAKYLEISNSYAINSLFKEKQAFFNCPLLPLPKCKIRENSHKLAIVKEPAHQYGMKSHELL
jgi:hypothetical protein